MSKFKELLMGVYTFYVFVCMFIAPHTLIHGIFGITPSYYVSFFGGGISLALFFWLTKEVDKYTIRKYIKEQERNSKRTSLGGNL